MAKRIFAIVLLTIMVFNLSEGFFLPKLPKLKWFDTEDSNGEADEKPLVSAESEENPFKLPKLFDIKLKPLKPITLKDLFGEKAVKSKATPKAKKNQKKEDAEKLLDPEAEDGTTEVSVKKPKKVEKNDLWSEKSIKDLFEGNKLKNLKLKDIFSEKALKNLLFAKKEEATAEKEDDDDEDDEDTATEKCTERYPLRYIEPKKPFVVKKKKKLNESEDETEQDSDEDHFKYFS